jgi:hypothetical protein
MPLPVFLQQSFTHHIIRRDPCEEVNEMPVIYHEYRDGGGPSSIAAVAPFLKVQPQPPAPVSAGTPGFVKH